MKRKIILFGILFNLFSFTSFASAPTMITPENEQMEAVNETILQETQIQEEINETVPIESTETLNETESEYPLVTLNFDVEFTFDTEIEPIYLIQVSIPNGLTGSDGEENYEIINLSSQNNFINTYQMNCYYEAIQLNANVDGDNAYLYNISFDGIEPASLFGDTIRNSGYIENPQNGDVYNLHLIVSQNEDATIKSPNDLSYNETDDFYEDVISGEYGESRAEERESSIAAENQPETEIAEENNVISVIAIVVIVIFVVAIAAGILYIKKLQTDDDE